MTSALSTPSVVSVLRLWPGETVVIIGGGSSLTTDDVEFCRGKARVIAIKEAYLLAPWADVLYAADPKWWRFYQGAPTFKGLKYSIEGRVEPHHLDEYPDVRILRNCGDEGLELDPTGLRTGFNSGYQAVNLAVHFGCSKIILLGFDMWPGPDGRQNWCDKRGFHLDSPYPVFHQAFRSIEEPLTHAGVHVVNASRFTLLNSFPRVSLEEALA